MSALYHNLAFYPYNKQYNIALNKIIFKYYVKLNLKQYIKQKHESYTYKLVMKISQNFPYIVSFKP
jgi:hypothetical protein